MDMHAIAVMLHRMVKRERSFGGRPETFLRRQLEEEGPSTCAVVPEPATSWDETAC